MASTSASIHRTLNLIVPTTTTLPPSLIDLATTLLAQSRAKVPSLKPDEEIARPFACCHIACERLKHRLALEIGKVGPPCGPRIYKRLYAFLDSSLAAEPGTPRTRRVVDGDGGATPVEVISGRLGNASGVKATPGSLGKRNRAAVELDSGASNLPQWTMPMIKHICEACETTRAATHVYAGVESVYRALQSAAQKAEAGEAATPSKRRRSNAGDADNFTPDILPMPKDEQIPALIIAVYIVTAEAMSGQNRPAANKSRQRKAQSAAEAFLITQENTAIEIKPKDIETYLQAAKQGWTDMEWYKNLRSTNDSNNGNENDTNRGADYDELSGPNTPRRRPAKTPLRRKEKHSQRKIGEEEQNSAGLLPGLGTMFQPAVDWLSEERRAEFEEWKEDLLGGVALVELEA